jgi:hypothetical protein
MTDHTTKIVRINGFDLTGGDDGEPLILDVDLGRALGLKEARVVRRLIKRWDAEIGPTRDTVTRVNNGRNTVTQRHLTEDQALFVASKSETLKGAEVLRGLIATCREYRRMMTAPAPVAVPTIDSHQASGPRINDNPETRAQVVNHVLMAMSAGHAKRTIHGWIRRMYRVSSPYYVGMSYWHLLRSQLIDIGNKVIAIVPTTRKPHLRLVKSNPRQLPLHCMSIVRT